MKSFKLLRFFFFLIFALYGCSSNHNVKTVLPDDIASLENRPVYAYKE